MATVRLGDVIDDHCTSCHMVMDHSVVAMVGEEVKRVRCRTCDSEHVYRTGQGPKKPQKDTKRSAYEEVLASITGGMPKPTSTPLAKSRRSTRSTTTRRRTSPNK
jgi:hypothetical protein